MWILSKDFSFEASHQLPYHDGKCRRLHGHSWKGTLICQGDSLQIDGVKTGMVVDYSEIKATINPIVEGWLDHYHLNDTLRLQSPTSELIAQWIFERVVDKLPSLVAVIIEETCTSRCEYRP